MLELPGRGAVILLVHLLGRKAALIFSTQAPARQEAGAAPESPSPSSASSRKLHHGKRSTKHPPWWAPNDPWDKTFFLHRVGSAQGPHGSLDASPLAVIPSPGSRGHTTQTHGTQGQQEHLPVQVMNTSSDTQFLSVQLPDPRLYTILNKES